MDHTKRALNWKPSDGKAGAPERQGTYNTQKITESVSKAFTKDLERIFEKRLTPN